MPANALVRSPEAAVGGSDSTIGLPGSCPPAKWHNHQMAADIHIEGLGPAPTHAGPLAGLLDSSELTDDVTHMTVVASDGYRASIPIQILWDGGILSIEGEAWRLKVADGGTLCWNVKGVVRLEPTLGRAEDDVPENPPH